MKKFVALLSTVALAATAFAALSTAAVASNTSSALTQNTSRQLVLLVRWTPAETDPRFPILRYEYTTDNGDSWSTAPSTGTDSEGKPTYDNPMRLSTDSDGDRIRRGQRYEVRLRAVNELGPGQPSELLAATLGPGTPALTASVTGTTIRLSWTAAAGTSSYRVIQDGTEIATTNAGTRSRTVTGTVATEYSFVVEAVNAGGSSPSNTATVTVPLPAPSLSGSVSGTSVSLSWTAVSGAAGYRVYRDNSLVSTTTSRSYSDTGRTQGQSYDYTVEAYKGAVDSARSDTYTASIPLPQPPSSPSSSSVSVNIGWPNNGVSNNVEVSGSWSRVSGADYYSYIVYNNWSYVTGGNVTNRSFSLSSQRHGGQYMLAAAACTYAAGCSDYTWSGVASARTISWPVYRGYASNGDGTRTWVDSGTGRRAYYGPSSEPAGRVGGNTSCPSGLTWSGTGYTMRDGTAVMWRRNANRYGWCDANESRFETDRGSEPSYNSWTQRYNWQYYSPTG